MFIEQLFGTIMQPIRDPVKTKTPEIRLTGGYRCGILNLGMRESGPPHVATGHDSW